MCCGIPVSSLNLFDHHYWHGAGVKRWGVWGQLPFVFKSSPAWNCHLTLPPSLRYLLNISSLCQQQPERYQTDLWLHWSFRMGQEVWLEQQRNQIYRGSGQAFGIKLHSNSLRRIWLSWEMERLDRIFSSEEYPNNHRELSSHQIMSKVKKETPSNYYDHQCLQYQLRNPVQFVKLSGHHNLL